jgi:hypothetical protein
MEKRTLRVFENTVLRIILGPKEDEIIGGWRKLHNEKLSNLYSSANRMIKSRRVRWSGLVARLGEKKCIWDFGRKPRRKIGH